MLMQICFEIKRVPVVFLKPDIQETESKIYLKNGKKERHWKYCSQNVIIYVKKN